MKIRNQALIFILGALEKAETEQFTNLPSFFEGGFSKDGEARCFSHITDPVMLDHKKSCNSLLFYIY